MFKEIIKKITENKIYQKYREPVTYIIYSGFTAVIEMIIGLILLNTVTKNEVLSNTISIVIGTIIHYFLVTKSTFKSEVTVMSVVIYLVTFFMGLGIQDGIVWLGCNKLFTMFGDNVKFMISKVLSLVVSFCFMFVVRKILYGWVNKKNQEKIKSNNQEKPL